MTRFIACSFPLRCSHAPATLLAFGICLFGNAALTAEEPYVSWATTGSNMYSAELTTISPSGDLYTASGDIFTGRGLLRFTPSGELAEQVVYPGLEVQGLTFDAVGNRYLTGSVWTNGTFSASHPKGFFVARFNAQNELVWVRSGDEVDREFTRGTAVRLDAEGNICVGGSIRRPETWEAYAPGDHDGIFLRKYSPEGDLLWARRMEHQNSGWWYDANVYDLSVDPTGRVVISGSLSSGVTTFGDTTVYPGSTDCSNWFLARYLPNGDLHWVQLGCSQSIATDRNGNIYASVGFAENVGAGLVKLAPDGTAIWSMDLPGYLEWPGGLTLDRDDEPVFTGAFVGTAQLGQFTLRSHGSSFEDFFVAKASAQGEIQWAMSGGGAGFDRGEQVVCDAQGNIYLTGVIRKNVATFDGFILTPRQGPDSPTLFAAKLSPVPPLRLRQAGGITTLTWPAKATNWMLEATGTLGTPAWGPANLSSTVSGRDRTATVDTAAATSRFYRLRKP